MDPAVKDSQATLTTWTSPCRRGKALKVLKQGSASQAFLFNNSSDLQRRNEREGWQIKHNTLLLGVACSMNRHSVGTYLPIREQPPLSVEHLHSKYFSFITSVSHQPCEVHISILILYMRKLRLRQVT